MKINLIFRTIRLHISTLVEDTKYNNYALLYASLDYVVLSNLDARLKTPDILYKKLV